MQLSELSRSATADDRVQNMHQELSRIIMDQSLSSDTVEVLTFFQSAFPMLLNCAMQISPDLVKYAVQRFTRVDAAPRFEYQQTRIRSLFGQEVSILHCSLRRSLIPEKESEDNIEDPEYTPYILTATSEFGLALFSAVVPSVSCAAPIAVLSGMNGTQLPDENTSCFLQNVLAAARVGGRVQKTHVAIRTDCLEDEKQRLKLCLRNIFANRTGQGYANLSPWGTRFRL